MDEPVMLEPEPGWQPFAGLPREPAGSIKAAWLEDKLVPATPEEMTRGLRECVARARAEGWIPAKDPGCQCLICRMWRATGI